jgi:release factor H-coupled RctB family protein
MMEGQKEQATVRIVASPKTWIEGEAVQQLERTAKLPGMVAAIGMPDLHPGKGSPIGAAFVCEGQIYPYLVGNDIGCGMALWTTSLKQRKQKLDRWAERLGDLDGPWEGDTAAFLAERGVAPTSHDASLGTIGGGNHFAELQQVDEVHDAEAWAQLGIDPGSLVLLVHSGSRGLGESILRAHVDRFAAGGLASDSEEARAYLQAHDEAVAWAQANRALIARRFAEALGAEIEPVLDVCHNAVVPSPDGAQQRWLHRKGAAPSTAGMVVIPGSRGTLSYVVRPDPSRAEAGWSLAHGAGRKWRRGDVRARLQGRYRPADLIRTELGGRVVCEDCELLYEEAPEAYKKIDTVVGDLVAAGLCSVVATLRPVLTYKTRSRR